MRLTKITGEQAKAVSSQSLPLATSTASSLQDVDAVVALLRSQVVARRTARRRMLLGAYGLLLVTILASFFGPRALADYSIWMAIFVGSGLLGGAALLQRAVRTSSRIADKRLVGPLLEATAVGEPEVEREAWIALKPLLFELDESDVLTEAQQRVLCRALESQDAERVVGAIHAVRTLKIYGAVPALESLANAKGSATAHLQNLALMALADLRMTRAGELISERSPSRDQG